MAEEKAAAAEASAATAPSKPAGQKPMLFIGLAVVNMVVVALVGGMIYMDKKKAEQKTNLDKIVEGEKTAQEKEAHTDEFIGKLVPLETFLVNLSGSRGRKLAKVSIELEVEGEEVMLEIEKLKPKIRDIIIIVLSGKSYSQLSTQEGKDSLRTEIRDQVNLFLTKGRIKRVYFTEFIYS